MEVGSGDVGMPGDKYRIRLRIAGKYRHLASEKQEHLRMLSRIGPREERFCGTSFRRKTMIHQRMLPRVHSPADCRCPEVGMTYAQTKVTTTLLGTGMAGPLTLCFFETTSGLRRPMYVPESLPS